MPVNYTKHYYTDGIFKQTTGILLNVSKHIYHAIIVVIFSYLKSMGYW